MSRILFFFCLIASPFVYGEQNHICLSMMINNDEKTIGRSLMSIKGLVDCASICNFGSTDNSEAIARNFFEKNKIPAIFYQCESYSIPKNHALSIASAHKTLKNLGLFPSSTYLLFLSPDQKINDGATISRELLSEEGYLTLEQSSSLSYYSYLPNLLKASLSENRIINLRERGSSTHIQPLTKIRSLVFEELSIEKKELQESELESLKIETIQKNVRFFQQAILDSPDNERYYLCLAQAYKALKEYEEAIACYQTRINKEGNPEELWFSKYMIGECYEALGKWSDAFSWYLLAYQFNPQRPEPIKKISSYYRAIGYNEVAYLFANHGIRISTSEQNILFPMPAIYDYQFDEEISIAAYYTQFKEEGYTAANDLLLRRDTPAWIKDQGYKNILFYAKPLKGSYESIKIPLPFVEDASDKKYNPMNPSIVKTEDGYKLICRAVNYTQVGAKHFYTPDPQGIFRTKNFLIYYDKSFKKLSQHEIIDDLTRERFSSTRVHGLEDCRIIELDQDTWFTCTSLDSNPTGAIQIALAKIDQHEIIDGHPLKVETFTPLIGPDPHRCEKNWLPFLKEGQLYTIYNTDPFTIFKPNLKTGECETILNYTPDYDFSRFRGSAAPIELDDGYLMLVHEVVMLSDNSRVYLHRFVYLDHTFRVKQVSKPFIFRQQGVEFCLSMTIDHTGHFLILPIGIEDREAWILTVPLDEIRSMLGPLPKTFPPY